MANETQKQQEAAVAEAVSRTETFFEENGKKVLAAILALIIICAGGYMYKKYIIGGNAEKAQALIVDAQDRLRAENPDYALVLNGDENGAGLLDVIEKYGSTPAGNLARHYAGACYLHMGEVENAEKYLSEYKDVDGMTGEIINAQNKGLLGDIASDAGDYAKAVKYYEKAIAASDNNYTTPLFFYKKGLALRAEGRNEEAKACFENLMNKYPTAMEAREAEKILGTIE